MVSSNIIATNPYEQWTASLVILIGTMTSLITEGDRVSCSIVNTLENAQHVCQRNRLAPEMTRAVFGFVFILFNSFSFNLKCF